MQRVAAGPWGVGTLARRRGLALAFALALLSGLWRVPGGWLVVRGMVQDILNAAPQGYAGALVLALGCLALALVALRDTPGRPRNRCCAGVAGQGA